MTDERKGLPSASGAHIWMNCADSHRMAQLIEAKRGPEPDSDAAKRGEHLHSVIEHWIRKHPQAIDVPRPEAEDMPADMDEEDIGAIRSLVFWRNKIVAEFIPEGASFRERFEERFWLRDPRTMDLLTSCRADYVIECEDPSLVMFFDWKMGRADVEDAPNNLQLRTGLVCYEDDTGNTYANAVLAIVQPWAQGDKKTTVSTYNRSEIAYARMEVIHRARMAASGEAQPRVAGEWCKWCDAANCCPEAGALAMVTVDTSAENWPDQVPTGRELEVYDAAAKIIERKRAAAKEALKANPGAIPGWGLSQGRQMASVDPVKAWASIGIKIGGAAFIGATNGVSLPKLAEKWHEHARCKSKKAAREEVEQMLEASQAMTVTRSEPSLERREK